jgi:hypothetical protein
MTHASPTAPPLEPPAQPAPATLLAMAEVAFRMSFVLRRMGGG